MKSWTIGKFSQLADTNIETIRYYEKRGLLPAPKRRPSGYREYTEDDIRRLSFIRQAKNLGFSLNEIGDLLELRVDAQTTCEDFKKRAEIKLDTVEQKILELRRIKAALHTLVSQCSGSGPAGECPIIEALESETQV